jgi:hypothetical protein
MGQPDKKNTLAFLLLSLIILFHLFSNLIWLKLDKTYLANDAHHHFLLSLNVFDALKENIFPSFSEVLSKKCRPPAMAWDISRLYNCSFLFSIRKQPRRRSFFIKPGISNSSNIILFRNR